MNFNKKILYALMVAGLCMPVTSVYAVWPFSSSIPAPLVKAQEKAKEEVKKEATAQSARLLSAAIKGTGYVADKALSTTNEAVKLGLKYPYATTALVAGGTVYYYRNEIKEKVKNAAATAAEYAGKAAPYAATATALAAAKYGYDWCKSLFRSPAAASQNTLPVVATPVVPAPQVHAQVRTPAWVEEYTQQQTAASQTEKTNDEAPVVTSSVAPAADWVQEFNGSHSVPRVNSPELRRMNATWAQIEKTHKEQAEAKIAQAEAAKKVAQDAEKARLEQLERARARANIYAIYGNKASEYDAGEGRLVSAPDMHLMDAFVPKEFTLEQIAQERFNGLTNVDVASITGEPQESITEDWAQEFLENKKHEDAEALKWVEEYNNTALNRARRIVNHLIPSTNKHVAVVHSLEDIESRMHQREMIATVNNLMPHCAPTSLRPL